MRKILFGTIVFFSLAFLAACGGGGSGSKGATGATGATGAAGADGTGTAGASGSGSASTAFQDANLSISYNGAAGAVPGSTPTAVPLDNGSVIGEINGALLISGHDNITSRASSNKYYLYEEDDSSVSRIMAVATTATLVENRGPTNALWNNITTDDGIIDTRFLTSSDDINVGLVGWLPLSPLTAGTSFTTKSINVCPGNVAGDGSCAKVLAPAYDRGIETTPAILVGTATAPIGLGSEPVATKASLTYTGSNFHVMMDNATTTTVVGGAGVVGYNIAPTKAGFGTAITTGDNTSNGFRPANSGGVAGITDNGSSFSNSIIRAASSGLDGTLRDVATVWVAMATDNATTSSRPTGGVPANVGPHGNGEGDNITLISRPANCTTQALCVGTDNGSGTDFATNHAALTTPPQIADAGDGTYVFLGAGATISAYNVRDNTTVSTLGAATTQAGGANTWCSTSTGAAGGYAVIASDNGSSSGAAGVNIHKLLDNGTTTNTVGTTALPSVTSGHTDLEQCALTHLGGTFYLALGDNIGQDNVSVWKSTNLTTWTQIGADLAMAGTINNLAITTLGSTVADTAVWVAVNDGGAAKLIHFEDIAGGSTNAWRVVGTVIPAIVATKISIATDGVSVIAVSGVASAKANVGFWYNQ